MDATAPTELATLVTSLQLGSFCGSASVALLFYDYCLTAHLEIKHVWFARWTYVKVIYFIARYLAVIDLPISLLYWTWRNASPDVCQSIFRYCAWSYVIGVEAGNVLLLLRTWAIWDKTKTSAVWLALFFVPVSIGLFVADGIFSTGVGFGAVPLPGMSACLPTSATTSLWPYYAVRSVLEGGILVLTLIKAIQCLSRRSELLITTLYRDALLFQSITLSTSVILLISYLQLPPTTAEVMIVLERTIHAVLSTRVILNLRDASSSVSEHQNWTTEQAMPSFRIPESLLLPPNDPEVVELSEI